MPNPKAEALKAQGNQFFKKGQYAEAIAKYTDATDIDASIPAYWSNMAACLEKLSEYDKMADAARACIKADRNFIKGYFRLATAQKGLNSYKECIKTLESGLNIQSSNSDLKNMKKDVTELARAEQVANYCTAANDQYNKGEIMAAMKTLDLASRLDAGNSDIERLMSKVKPKFEQMEKRRKSGLSLTERYKENGDVMYKDAKFEEAVIEYTKCLEALKKSGGATSQLALKALSNRAACNKQISHFDGVIEDCTAVLEIDQDNVKALVRRAQAFEGVERYRFALQDVKSVLMMPYPKVGKSNFDLCNGMQYRLQRTVNQLKAMNNS